MEPITIEITILKPLEVVWQTFTDPKHITKWNFAQETWHCPSAENNLNPGGGFLYRMEARDGSFGFDLKGVYDEIIPLQLIKYHLEDGRSAQVQFIKVDEDTTKVVQSFEPEAANSREMQREGWYKILDNFHRYTENN